MEFAQAYFLLCLISDFYGDDGGGHGGFKSRLVDFMRAEEMSRPKLHRQLQAFRADWWNKNVATGRLGPKSWLYPRDPEVFDVLIRDLKNNKRALMLHLRAVDEAAKTKPSPPSAANVHRADVRKSASPKPRHHGAPTSG
jgi:hypothetical protein